MALNKPIERWSERRVWVIGASTGIGAAVAHRLARKGAGVALSARNRQRLEAAASTMPRGAIVLPLDVTRREEIASALGALRNQWGRVDLVLIFAGTHRSVRAWELTAAQARELVDTNLMGPLNVLEAAIPELVERRSGGIALVSSVAGYGGLPTSLLYGATKAALINLAETLYLDLKPRGIDIYLVNPGFVKTPLTDRNEFRMPALISAEEAAREIVRGLEGGAFEIHFPKRFTLAMKLLRLLPYRLYFPLVRRATGL